MMTYAVYRNLEGLLVNAANNAPHEEYLDRVTSFYKDDVNRVELSAQLRNPWYKVFQGKTDVNCFSVGMPRIPQKPVSI